MLYATATCTAADDLANILLAYPRRFKRHRQNTSGSVDDSDTPISDCDDSSPSGYKIMSLRIRDTQEITKYYESALKHFQQLNCRMVAKAFIKFIEPRKQVRHPYNGGKPSPGSAPGTTGDPEKTKPEWWPPGVMHKEPDHLRKVCMFLRIVSDSYLCTNLSLPDRIQLLLHIIRELGDHGITADKLKEVASDTKRSLKHPSHLEIILEILRVRKVEERYERGEDDGNTMVKVKDRGPSPKDDEVEGSADSPAVTDSAAGHIEEGLLTPSYSIEQPVASSATPINMTGMPAHTVPGSFTPLIFESQQSRPSYAISTQDKHVSSQSMHISPFTAERTSADNFPVSDYQSQSHFPTLTPNQQCGGLLSPYDVLPTPSFPDNTFNPVGYNTPPLSQPLSQPSAPHSISMEPPASLHALHPHSHYPEDPGCLSRSIQNSSRVTCTVCYPSRY